MIKANELENSTQVSTGGGCLPAGFELAGVVGLGLSWQVWLGVAQLVAGWALGCRVRVSVERGCLQAGCWLLAASESGEWVLAGWSPGWQAGCSSPSCCFGVGLTYVSVGIWRPPLCYQDAALALPLPLRLPVPLLLLQYFVAADQTLPASFLYVSAAQLLLTIAPTPQTPPLHPFARHTLTSCLASPAATRRRSAMTWAATGKPRCFLSASAAVALWHYGCRCRLALSPGSSRRCLAACPPLVGWLLPLYWAATVVGWRWGHPPASLAHTPPPPPPASQVLHA